MDPSGNIPSLGGIGNAIGDAVVGAAKHAPESWKPGIRNAAQKGNDFLNWWKSNPDDCECNQNPGFVVDTTHGLNTGANYLAQAARAGATTSARATAGLVGAYARAPVPNQYRTLGNTGYRLLRQSRNANVTGWIRGNYIVDALDNVATGRTAYLLRSNNGRKILYLRNVRLDTPNTNTGFAGSIVGAGLIDAAFQVLGDWASNLCLSPEQYAWRALIALEFGLLAGVFGAAAGVGAVAFGASSAVATGVSIGIGVATSIGLIDLKRFYLDKVANAY